MKRLGILVVDLSGGRPNQLVFHDVAPVAGDEIETPAGVFVVRRRRLDCPAKQVDEPEITVWVETGRRS